MSLPTFKITSLKPTLNDAVNSGLAPGVKLKKAENNVISDIISNAKSTASNIEFPAMPSMPSMPAFSSSSSPFSFMSSSSSTQDDETSYLSYFIRFVGIAVIGWFMWFNLANNSEFNLEYEKIAHFFSSFEENGRKLYERITSDVETPVTTHDDDEDDKPSIQSQSQSQSQSHNNIPVPPSMTNSSNKQPGFSHEDPKYTFLDRAVRDYSGSKAGQSPVPDDSTSKIQKHQSGKTGYCYIGEDRGFRSCINVEAGDKCMSG